MRGLLSGFARLPYGIRRIRGPAAEWCIITPRSDRNASQLHPGGVH